MTNIAKQVSEWDIETVEKRLKEIDAALSADVIPTAANGFELLSIAQRAAELALLSEKRMKELMLAFEPLIKDVEKTARDSFATSSETFENDFFTEDPDGFTAWKIAKNKLEVLKNATS